MGKRSSYDLKPRDFYRTIDESALPEAFVSEVAHGAYAEPCCGDGSLMSLLDRHGIVCGVACDIAPQGKLKHGCYTKDALTLTKKHLSVCDRIITNPPYTWSNFQPLIDHLLTLGKPVWFLLPADWMHNKRMQPYMKQCKQVISIGRLYWEENKVKGKDNYCWYQFIEGWDYPTVFIVRE